MRYGFQQTRLPRLFEFLIVPIKRIFQQYGITTVRSFTQADIKIKFVYRSPDKIDRAAFSAIMTVGELVLPEVIVGITEASGTLSPAIPMTRKSLSTTALVSSRRPILQVPTG